MNIEKIKEAVNGDYNDSQKRMMILHVIAEDKKAIPIVMDLLNIEREDSREVLMDMNLELSRSHIFIDSYIPETAKLRKNEKGENFNQKFVLDKISEFYVKYKGKINHCFNRFNN